MSNQRAKKHSSKLITGLLNEITPQEQQRVDKRMKLAARLDEALKARGWSQKTLSERLSKSPSEISKWLSGFHNFTSDTLFDLEEVLGIGLINVSEQPVIEVVNVFSFTVRQVSQLPRIYPERERPGEVVYLTEYLDLKTQAEENKFIYS